MTSHHLGLILLARSKSQVPPIINDTKTWQTRCRDYWERGVNRVCSFHNYRKILVIDIENLWHKTLKYNKYEILMILV